MVDPSRQRRRREKRRQEIYQAALQLFVEHGYEKVTVADITRAADVAKGTFFNYFPSKEHLLLEYRRSLFDFIHAYGETLQGDSARELFQKYFRKLARRIRSEGDAYGMLLQEVVARPHLVALDAERQDRYLVLAQRFLRVGQTAGEVPDGVDLKLLAETIRDVWNGTSIGWVLEKPSGSLETRITRKLDLLFDLLAGRVVRG
jgi:AcrR family transcriptional regulator